MIAIVLYILGFLLSFAVWSYMIESKEVLNQFDEEQLKSISENKFTIKFILSIFWPIVAIAFWVF